MSASFKPAGPGETKKDTHSGSRKAHFATGVSTKDIPANSKIKSNKSANHRKYAKGTHRTARSTKQS
jgi:hypothetical protein